jgi:hypothetical protein
VVTIPFAGQRHNTGPILLDEDRETFDFFDFFSGRVLAISFFAAIVRVCLVGRCILGCLVAIREREELLELACERLVVGLDCD